MARGAGGTTTQIEPGLIARVGAALRGAVQGWRDAWMGPGTPQVAEIPEAKGRQFDYSFGINTAAGKPRAEQGENAIDFPTLRALAEPAQGGLDLVRLAIERRKDQMESQDWTIRGRDGGDGGDPAKEVTQRLRRPDIEHTFAQWMRMLVEDMLVIDAATIYLAPTTLGYQLPQVMDGATLKRLVTVDGRTPLPPDPAFQQVLKGIPATNYTLEELVYSPRNPRSNRVYGMSPVEQVLMTVNIALRRQGSQLEYYTAGNIPDSICAVPDSWSPAQIRDFQTYFDAMAGDSSARRKLRFVPGGMKFFETKEQGLLKDEFDEWLARIVCFCFSLSPQSLMKQMNRATAQTAKESAQEEGLEPIKAWFKGMVDVVIERGYGQPDLELAWIDEEIANPVDKANVLSIGLGRGGGKAWWTVDEVRAKYGDDPMTDAQKEELAPPPPPAVAPAAPNAADDAKAQEEAKAELVELQKRAAEPGFAQAAALQKLAEAIAPRSRRKVKFYRNGDGVVNEAEVIE